MPKKPEEAEQKTERFNMFMSPSEMAAIDEWAWKNRIRSKSEAVRRLVNAGLELDRGGIELYKSIVDAMEKINELNEKLENILVDVPDGGPLNDEKAALIGEFYTDFFVTTHDETWNLLNQAADTIQNAWIEQDKPRLLKDRFRATVDRVHGLFRR